MASAPVIKPGIMINNKAALNRKLKEIKLNHDWIETLVLTNSGSGEGLPDDQVDHDFNREMHFYRQAQSAALEGLKRLHSLNIPTRRPDDYFAEMAKSDAHMLKVKKALVEREAVLSKIERAKKMRQEKKMAKMVQSQVKIAKQAEKKELMQKVSRYQKGKDKSLDFLNDKPAKKKEVKPIKKVSKKVLHKKKVYGFGGQKKRSKYNTAESAADVSSFRKGKVSRSGPSRGGSSRGGPSRNGSSRSGPSRGGFSRGGFSRGGFSRGGSGRGDSGRSESGRGGSSRGGSSRGGSSRGGTRGGRGASGPRSKPQARRGGKR